MRVSPSTLAVPLFAMCVGATMVPVVRADDWPQYRGPDRSGVSRETGLLKSWPKDGPPLLWAYRYAGVGFTPPSVVGDRLYGPHLRSVGRDARADDHVASLDRHPPAGAKARREVAFMSRCARKSRRKTD